jgi:phospho-N-acetylmuramoyl-pentapeptide-transferase
MFYYLAEFRDYFFGFNIFKYITFRASMASVTTFFLCLILGPIFIRHLKSRKVSEVVKREDCPGLTPFHQHKEGTPTMGGVFIIVSIVIAVLLWADLSNPYILLTLFSCLYLGILGYIDDHTKLTKNRGKQRGMRARTKFLWEILLGFFIGSYLYFNPDTAPVISAQIDIPFLKSLLPLGWLYIPFIALVVIGTCNAVNLTDGLDGLAIGCVLIVSATLGLLCYLTGHIKFSSYLFIPYVAGTGELTVFCSAMVGASLGFLWFNCYPATIFMGDTGSLSLGGSLGVIAALIKKEILLILLGGVFVMEAMSVILQVASFKIWKKRIFKISPFHHHLQMCGWAESKIITRLWIIGIICALLTLTTLKVR